MIGYARKTAKHLWLWWACQADKRQRKRLGMENRDLTPDLWGAGIGSNGHLTIGGCDAVDLARQYGTPLFVVDMERLKKNYSDFLSAFQRPYPHVEVYYSYKTNPLPGALAALHELGAGAEVVSHFELWLALELGVAPERVIFNGPAKTEEALALAISRGIQLINIDNVGEIDAIERLACKAGRKQNVGVRVVTSVGWSSQFGLSIRAGAALNAFQRALQCRNLEPCGLHVHLGTGIKDMGIYLHALTEVFEFANELRDRHGIKIRFFDFGGGFGVPTVRPFSATDVRLMANGLAPAVIDVDASPGLASYGSSIVELFMKYRPPAGQEDPVMIFEPGRAVTSSAQTLLLTVLSVKPKDANGGSVILDGGRNVAMPPAFEYHEVLAASRMLESPSAPCDLFGPLCHPGDVLCLQKRLPKLEPGDVVAVMDAGAYFIPNQMNFCNPRPGAVMVRQGMAELTRNRESFEDIVRLDQVVGVGVRS